MTGPATRETMHALISGMVQGVGFRYFVLQHGRRLGLDGRASNLPDGRVEVWAAGPRKDLEALVVLLHLGPSLSRVTEVKVDWGVQCPPMNGFGVGY